MIKFDVLIVLLFIANTVDAQSSGAGSKTNDTVIKHIHQAMETQHIPGLAVAVMKGNKLMLSQGFGHANIEHQIPGTTKSVFQIASVTKVFTAIAALILFEKGQLRLDDPVGNYLTNLPETWNRITIRQLLSHTSGIPSFSGYDSIPCKVGKDVRDYLKGDVLKEVACLPLEFEPGENWSYGDTGFYIIGLLIEKVSGKSYEEFLRETVFKPLGMASTRLVSYRDIITNRVDGYAFENGNYYNSKTFEFDEFANGGIVSNVEDMIKMHFVLSTEKLLAKQTLAIMCTQTQLKNGKLIDYGLGIGLTPYKGQKRYGHNGGGGLGFSSSLTHFPDDNITVVVLSNANLPRGYVGELVNEIASYYFK